MTLITQPRLVALALAATATGLLFWLDTPLTLEAATLGVVIGLVYVLLAVALSLTERVSGVVNLALGVVGALAATIAVVLDGYEVWWLLVVLAGLCAGFLTGAGIEVIALQRLKAAPRLVAIMATSAVAVALARLGAQLNTLSSSVRSGSIVEVANPSFLPTVEVGSYRVSGGIVLLAVLVPAFGVLSAWLLLRTRTGLMVQAAADDSTLARMAGIPATRITTIIWGVCGVVAGLLALFGPFAASQVLRDSDVAADQVLGLELTGEGVFRLVVWPLVIAAVGRSRDIPAMVLAGMTFALFEEAMIWHGMSRLIGPGLAFAFVLLSAITVRYESPRAEPGSAWLLVQVDSGWPEFRNRALNAVPSVVPLVGLAIAVLIGATASADNAADMAAWIGLAVIGLAMFVEAGMAGSLSFGYLPTGAVGSAVTIFMLAETGSLPLGIAAAMTVGALIGIAGGLIEQRAGRVSLMAVTVIFLVVAFHGYTEFTLDHPNPGVPVVGGTAFGPKSMLALTGALAVAAFLVVRSLHRSRAGRALVAQRDNRQAAAAFGFNANRLRLMAGAVSGAIAALGGTLLMQSATFVEPQRFSIFIGFALMFSVAMGGVTGPYGPIVGTALVFALPLLGGGAAGLISAGVGLGGLVVVLAAPTGLHGLWADLRSWAICRWLGKYLVDKADPVEAAPTPLGYDRFRERAVERSMVPGRLGHGEPILEAVGIAKSFGGVGVLRGVDLTVRRGEIVSLIGPNGAGKTTTFDVLSGFIRPDAGSVRFDGEDVTGCPPHALVARGLVRTHQDAALFATLTVEEVLELATSSCDRRLILKGLVGFDGQRCDRLADVAAALERFGLEGYRDYRVAELSTGTRRIVELAASVLLQADLLLLDEPSAGIAQREVEKLGDVLMRFRQDYGTTILLIEHDIPLCRKVSDRMLVMADGQMIATGNCERVLNNQMVIERYLGTSEAAMTRSGATSR